VPLNVGRFLAARDQAGATGGRRPRGFLTDVVLTVFGVGVVLATDNAPLVWGL
jgi:hypothetical protein